jgi:hypothetical protein
MVPGILKLQEDGKKSRIFWKVAKTVTKTSKLKLKIQNNCIELLLNVKISLKTANSSENCPCPSKM